MMALLSVLTIYDSDNLRAELQFLHKTLKNNGYDNNIIRKSTYKNSRPEANEQDPEPMNMKQKAFLPYIGGTTDRIGKPLKKFNIKTVYNAPHKISHSLVKVKDKLPYFQSAGIYMIPCSCGLKYIGQTGRTVEDRRKEHIRLCKYGPYEKSAIVLHSADSGHAIEFDNIKIIDKEGNIYRRLVKEAIHTKLHPNNINKDNGLQLSNSWGSLFKIIHMYAALLHPDIWHGIKVTLSDLMRASL
ncbi:hypothetical protein ANN_23440 [Periplaneta americana]|uniref:GIY-YIG domain-containing protein n=1 Tax=Periplaneta americana TaxID=6978 RepID=A0ABQ8SM09_PERAM|nr:hypothetical protein ANN_23440 [Periplaneta americana]